MGKGDRWVRRDRGRVHPLPSGERQLERAELGEHRIGREAAREIAKKIEDKGGFWGKRKDS
jgi:hypothetical protein